jgi:hypothetical protein
MAADDINERIVTVLEEDHVALVQPMSPGRFPGTAWTEFTVGAGTLDWTVEEAADALAALVC